MYKEARSVTVICSYISKNEKKKKRRYTKEQEKQKELVKNEEENVCFEINRTTYTLKDGSLYH